MTNDVIVIGAGVAGLTSAIALAEAGHRVRVVSRDRAGETTSALAGALCWPYRIQPERQAVQWSVRTFHALAELAGRPEETGVRMVPGTMVDAGGWEPEQWLAAVPGVRPATGQELPESLRGHPAWRARTPLVEMPVHLRYLQRRLAAAGGSVERRPFTSLAEAGREAGVVVNCSGLGARELVPDTRVHPVQGQLVIVQNPGIEEWFVTSDGDAGSTTYVMPQPFGVVLGGTAREHAWSREPDPAVAAAIVERCALIHPELARARVLAHRVGLRPGRAQVRLESERLDNGALCFHNYGHGGAGVTVSWGCALEVAAAVREAVA